MPRIPRVPSLQPLQRGIACSSHARAASPFSITRALSTSSPAAAPPGKNTEWIRGKLWKGDAPGPEDPYTQRPEPEEAWTPAHEDVERGVERRPNTRLALPPRRTEAIAEAEVKAADPTYVPAETMEDLETIAPLKQWWEQPGHWGEESAFRGFARVGKVLDKELVEVYLRRALVEALVLKEAGKFPKWATKKWRVGEREQLDQTLAVEIEIVDGQLSLKGEVGPVTHNLLARVSNKAAPEEVDLVSVDEAREMVKAWDQGWKEILLTDDIKFALRKRLYQFTGVLISDAKFGAARTVRHLVALGSKQPPAAKLADLLEQRGDLPQLANVKVHDRKVRLVDKETAVGRWKVIEEELQKRDLPALGMANLPRRLEAKWMRGTGQ